MAKTKQSTALAIVRERELEMLVAEFPVEPGFNRIQLPRLGLVSQDKTEGKGKVMKVVEEAGTFYTSEPTSEKDDNGKSIWKKNELGTEVEGIILFKRKQLSFFDGERYTKSPVYDADDQVIPLFKEGKEIARGTPAELKGRKEYEGVSRAGKPMSKLEDNRVLYVLLDDIVYQMTLRGTSMYSYQKYERATRVPTVVTEFTSEPQENGSTAWNMMTFKAVRQINGDELEIVKNKLAEIKEGIVAERAFYANLAPAVKEKVEGGMEF